MKKTRLYKNISLWLVALFTSCLFLMGQTGLAKDEDIAPEIIYYDYVDEHGVLKGGSIKVYADDPLHSRYKGAKGIFRESSQQFNVETIIDNGDPNNRVDLVIIGDGYDVNDINDGIYKNHVNSIIHRLFLIDGFFSQSPLDEYVSFFNVHRVDVISTDSGVDHDPCYPIWRDTDVNMGFYTMYQKKRLPRLLTIGDTEAAEAAANQAPDKDIIMALANSTKYGGSGGIYVCLSGGNESRVETALHEFGHSFAKLGDEYFDEPNSEVYSGDGSDLDLKANASILDANDMNDSGVKWYRWLDWGPEPKDVWTFPGSVVWNDTRDDYVDYNDGVYRPDVNSKMRSLGRPFGQVNTEQFILKIYELVNPIDYATPAGTYAIGTQFFVQPVKPAAHSLDVTWYIVGDPDPVGTGLEFDSSALDLPTGQYTLKVQVIDNTEMVRDEGKRDTDMNEVLTWTLGEAGHWKFNEGSGDTAYDYIGDIDGTLGGKVGADPCDPDWVNDPNRGWCLDFDGDDDYVSLSDMNALADNSTTIAAWIKADDVNEGRHPIVTQFKQVDDNYYGYYFYVNGNNPKLYLGVCPSNS